MSHRPWIRLTALLGIAALPALAGWARQGARPPAELYWPEWRGPLGTGASPTADPPTTWSEIRSVAWKVKLPGSGTSSPIVWGDRIFVQTAVPVAGPGIPQAPEAEPGQAAPPGRRGGRGGAAPAQPHAFTLLCIDRSTGRTLWQRVARQEVPHEGHHPDHGFSSHSPVTDGQQVYAYFGSRGLHCFGMDGSRRWSKDLGRMRTKMAFGEGSSPTLHDGILVVNWDHEGEDFIVALDARTGQERWRQARDEDTSWATPLVVRHGGRAQVVTSATRRIRSYDLASGRLLWECAGMTANTIPTPVADAGTVYATSGFRGSALLAIRLGREGSLTGTDAIAWSHSRSTPYVPSPLLYGNRLYFLAGNTATLSCFDARTGRPVLEAQRLEGLQGVYASPVGAAGRIYVVGRNGATVVLKRSDSLEVLATNRLDERIDASPALAGKDLILRGQEHLYCLRSR